MADIYGMLMDGMQSARAGADAKKKRGLYELIGKAYSAPQVERQQFLGQAVSLDPQAGFAASKGLGDMDDDKRAQVARQAQIFATLPDEQKMQAYPQLAAEVGSLTGQQLPSAYDAKFLPMIEKVASWSGGTGNTVQSQKIDADGNIWTTMRDGTMVNTGVKADRQMWFRDHPGMDPELVGKDGVARPVGGGFPQQPSPQPQGVQMQSMPYVIDDPQNIPPQVRQAIGQQEQASGNRPEITPGQAASVSRPWTANTPNPYGNATPRMGGARPSEAQTAAEVEAAKQRAQLAFLPQSEGIKADAAVGQALAIDRNKAGVDMEKVGMERSRDAETTLALLEDAEQLVKMSTGSALGNARDSALGMIGKSTQGGEAISALQTIAGQLTSKMPRMQGPQSDKDVELYKQMAGDLANPNLPRGRRLAALAQIRRLNQKYTQSQQQAAPGGTGGWGIRAKK